LDSGRRVLGGKGANGPLITDTNRLESGKDLLTKFGRKTGVREMWASYERAGGGGHSNCCRAHQVRGDRGFEGLTSDEMNNLASVGGGGTKMKESQDHVGTNISKKGDLTGLDFFRLWGKLTIKMLNTIHRIC